MATLSLVQLIRSIPSRQHRRSLQLGLSNPLNMRVAHLSLVQHPAILNYQLRLRMNMRGSVTPSPGLRHLMLHPRVLYLRTRCRPRMVRLTLSIG